MEINGYPMISMDNHRYPRISSDINGYPWISLDIMDTHGHHARISDWKFGMWFPIPSSKNHKVAGSSW
jgi:hypothetical protein